MRRYFLIAIIFTSVQIFAQNKTIDSLKQRIETAKEDTNKVQDQINLGWSYQWNEPDSAIQYGLQAMKLSQQLNYIDGEIKVASLLSEALSGKGNFSEALQIDFHALQLAEKMGRQNLFDESGIGNVYFYSGDYTKALGYYLQVKKKNESFPIKIMMGYLGETYYHLGQLDSAFFYISKSYQLDENDTAHWSVPYYYMALIETQKGKFNEAIDNYKLGLLISKNPNLDLVNGYNGIAMVFNRIGKVDSSIFYAKEAISLAQIKSFTPNVMDASALLTELYIKINTDSAFKYQRILLAAKDSLFSEEKVKQLQNLSFNEQMRQQEEQQTLQQAELKYRNRLNVYVLLAGVILLLIVAVGLWRRNIYKQKSFALLQKQKQETDNQKGKVEKTLEELRNTQSQLIQSEKMASLGELTAGIAHEIQNPLNFMNNFSEVNAELIEEMQQEMEKGNFKDAKAISNEIKSNEEKINHHGQRADAIVKGMLQHSRASTSQKELANINAIVDECLRLSYHALRARDKSFKANLQTDFDESIVMIPLIQQDIVRVFLNVFNNAFYAINEKSKQQISGYEPIVSVITKQIDGKVEIMVRDNGNGIPQKIKDKIFQPFFTTKPTGQGTGLGLSLSYDIIKAHGGEIKVETKEGEYSEFIIHLPFKIN